MILGFYLPIYHCAMCYVLFVHRKITLRDIADRWLLMSKGTQMQKLSQPGLQKRDNDKWIDDKNVGACGDYNIIFIAPEWCIHF